MENGKGNTRGGKKIFLSGTGETDQKIFCQYLRNVARQNGREV